MDGVLEFTGWVVDGVIERRDQALRLLLACALGGWIGLEREASGKPAGFRTNLIICLGAALVTEISLAISHAARLDGGAQFIADPGRIAAQVVSGIGFLGAGTIIQSRGSVQGLTTAATLWVVAMIGIGVGAQAYVEVVIATLLVVTALRVLGRVDDHLFPGMRGTRVIEIVLHPQPGAVAAVFEQLRAAGAKVLNVEVERGENRTVLTIRATGLADHAAAITDSLLELEVVAGAAIR
jgi:putative Mg2+ transporter-C (MgtC) family protein